MAFELLNQLLESKGIKTDAKKSSTPLKEARVKETDVLYNEIDTLVESAIRETLSSTILESFDGGELKRNLSIIESSVFSEKQTSNFIEETIDPILETVGTINSNRIVKNPSNKIKGVLLPVYEIALTLEAARMGALTAESLEDKCLKEEVDPNAQELEDVINSSIDQTYDMGKKKDIGIMATEPTSRMYDKVVREVTDEQLVDVEQNLKNNMQKIPADGGGSAPSQSERHADEVDFKKASDIKSYEGKEAGTDDKLFTTTEEKLNEMSAIGKIIHKLYEMMDQEEGADVEPKENLKDTNLKTFTGEEAGLEGPGANAGSGELGADGISDEAIVENQINLSRFLLATIFKEYGITNDVIKKALVREAVHYLFKYGVRNIYPAVSDVSHLVTEQNKARDISNGELKSAKAIVEASKPVLTKTHRKQILEKSIDMLKAIKNSKSLNESANGTSYETVVMEAVSNITKASDIERTRQAFRFRMNKFNENVKVKVVNGWSFKDGNLSEAAKQTKDYITVKRYIKEAPELKTYFNTLKEESPIAKCSFKKSVLNNDSLVSASIMTEVALIWNVIRENYYNKKPLNVKLSAINTMLETSNTYASMFSAMRNPKAGKQVLESFRYRLQTLKDKITFRLKNK